MSFTILRLMKDFFKKIVMKNTVLRLKVFILLKNIVTFIPGMVNIEVL